MGVEIQSIVSPKKHINKIFGGTKRMLGNVKVAFHIMKKDMMNKIKITLITPKWNMLREAC